MRDMSIIQMQKVNPGEGEKEKIRALFMAILKDISKELPEEKLPVPTVDHDMMELYDKLLYSCGILGWMQSFVDNINAGYYSCFNIGRFIRVRFKDRFHWNEYIEEQYCSWYSSMVAALKKDEYEELDKKLPGVLETLKQSVFVWDKAFLGYTTDYEIEDFFQKHALLDTQQSTEWELFPENSKFGSISYGDIVEAIVELSGYAIKHVYCACVLKNKQIDLKIENLLHIILMGSDLVRLIGENRGISENDAKDIRYEKKYVNKETKNLSIILHMVF